jgi:ribulose-5-phosphate 4-epimerase/fuculose-1-phosphate aldolase
MICIKPPHSDQKGLRSKPKLLHNPKHMKRVRRDTFAAPLAWPLTADSLKFKGKGQYCLLWRTRAIRMQLCATGEQIVATAFKTQPSVSAEEWAARQELAACYRIFAMFGWDELIYNHITVKVPGEDGAFLINPYGMHFSEVTASSLVKIDGEGNKVDADNPWHVNKAGFVQHSLFHRELPDAHAIIHTHTTATVAVSSLEGGLQPINFYACSLTGLIAYHDFEGITVRDEEGVRLLENLGEKRILMLRNHGPVVMGKTLASAFSKYWVLQRACEHQIETLKMGTPITVPEAVIAVHQRDQYLQQTSGVAPGQMEFDAMVRLVDKIDTGWRD